MESEKTECQRIGRPDHRPYVRYAAEVGPGRALHESKGAFDLWSRSYDADCETTAVVGVATLDSTAATGGRRLRALAGCCPSPSTCRLDCLVFAWAVRRRGV